MAKSRKRKGHNQKLAKRNDAINKQKMRKVEIIQHNAGVLDQVLKEFAQEKLIETEKDKDSEDNS